MASRVIMPKLTDSMEEGVVVKWRKAEGDHVESGDALAEIETDKAVMDLEAFASGTLRKILVPEGTTVPSGALIGVIAEPDEDIQALLTKTPSASPKAAAAKRETVKPEASSPEKHAASSPRVRTLAREHGIDLTKIKGSGPGGRIVERDLEPLLPKKAATDRGAGQPSVTEVPLSQMRKAIARLTAQSKGPVPHFYVTIVVDMDAALKMVQESKKQATALTINHLIIGASARALSRHGAINAAFAGDTLRQFSRIDIGIAVALDDGLIVPVLRDCGAKTLAQIGEAEHAMLLRAKRRDLAPEEYTGATFLISNMGMFDVESFSAIILPPAAAALAIGAVREVPVIRKGAMEIGREMKLTLSCDHRVIDGVVAAGFLQSLKHGLEHPAEL